jgi:AcrR family transcriptional regulator
MTTTSDREDPTESATSLESLRRSAVLDAAITVFARFGYRKTSMDEVALAARVSRQGLYLYFANKEELFRAAIVYALGDQLAAASAVLADAERPVETRLVAALDEWLGRHVGTVGTDASDLIETSGLLAGSILSDYEKRFEQVLGDAIGGSHLLMAAYAPSGLSSLQLARTLHATARGFKDNSKSRDAFVKNVAVAVRVLCAPFQKHPKEKSVKGTKRPR